MEKKFLKNTSDYAIEVLVKNHVPFISKVFRKRDLCGVFQKFCKTFKQKTSYKLQLKSTYIISVYSVIKNYTGSLQ